MSILDEQQVKAAVSQGRLRMSKSRKGRRPMRVTTFLRKEKDGSLYKAAGWEERLDKLKKRFSKATGVEPEELSRQRILGTVGSKMKEELEDVIDKTGADKLKGGLADNKKPSDFKPEQLRKGTEVEKEHVGSNSQLAREIAMDHLVEHPEYYTHLERMEKKLEKEARSVAAAIPYRQAFAEAKDVDDLHERYAALNAKAKEKKAAGPVESKLPWYTTALGGTSGAMVGRKLLKKSPVAGALLGTLAGTAAGLEGGEALGKRVDKMRKQAADLERKPKAPNKEVFSKAEPTAEVRVRMRGDTKSFMSLLKELQRRGGPGHSFGIYEGENGKTVGACLGGWDGDGADDLVSAEATSLEKESELKPGKGKKNSAGFKLQGRTDVQGLPIAIENRRGSVREGENDDGSKWRTKFKVPYGYIEGTKGKDGEEIDAYVGADKGSPKAFVIHQHNDDGKGHDEDTVMLGFKSKAEAEKAFLEHYDDPKYKGKVVTVGVQKLKEKLDKKPEQKKLANSGGTMQRMFGEGASRGVQSQTYIMGDSELQGKPANSKVKPGDSPSRDESPTYVGTENQVFPGLRSMDLANKLAASMTRLVGKDEYPTRSDVGRQDPAATHRRVYASTRWAGADDLTTENNPNWEKNAYVVTDAELEQVLKLASAELSSLDAMKLASGSFEELRKEAILKALRRVLPKKKLVQVGDEVVDLTPEGAYTQAGKHLKELGKGLKLKKGVTPEQAAAVGQKSTAGGRILGEGLESAGEHMVHASTAGRAMNPLGKPVGGAIEGITRGAGQELQRAAGRAAEVGAGGIRGSLGRGLVQQAPRVGQLGEIAGAAGTATMLGQAVSPAAAGLAAVAKATGTYAPLKGAIGHLGLNVAKDTAAHAIEKGVKYAPRAIRAARGLATAAG